MGQLRWTLLALTTLGGTALADERSPEKADMMVEGSTVRSSARGVAQDYLVAPEGGELTGQMKFITSDPVLAGSALKFTDLALFELAGRWSLFSKLELAASVDFLPKQPSYTDEKPWQSAGGTVRTSLSRNVAVAIGAGGGHLIDHAGAWTRESLTIEWKKPIDREFLAFDVSGGIDGLGLTAPNTKSTAFLTELAVQTTALFHEPSGHWGAWLGIGYAIPVQSTGRDPTTELAIDPQPRLDFHVGTVLALVPKWDLYVDFAVVDRGDAGNPATRLPILDGGFDQKQIMFGVTRHIDAPHHRHDGDGDAMIIGSR